MSTIFKPLASVYQHSFTESSKETIASEMFAVVEIALDVFSFLSRVELEKCQLVSGSIRRIVDANSKTLPCHQLEEVAVVCSKHTKFLVLRKACDIYRNWKRMEMEDTYSSFDTAIRQLKIKF